MQYAIPAAFLAAIFGQNFSWSDLAVIGLLVLLEGVLSIDNALVLGLLAKRLPKRMRGKALSYGIIGAFVFRTIAVLTAAYLLQWTFVKFLGGAYLVYIAVKHLFFEAKPEEEDKIALDASGNLVMVEGGTAAAYTAPAAEPESRADFWRFWKTVGVIEMTDIAFAVDSILAAIALAGGRHSKLWVIITGGILGMIMMRFAAAAFIRLLDRFPRFELSAYLLVIVIGLKLLVDWGFNSDWSFDHQPFFANRLGGSKQTFNELEVARRNLVSDYDRWLAEHWLFNVQHESREALEPEPGELLAPHVPHLLDFHDLRFPECLLFWLLMVVCFCVGFWPPKKHAASHAPA